MSTRGSTSDDRAPTAFRVAVVGGLTRNAERWHRAGEAIGVTIEHHDGRVHGRGVDEIFAVVRRADVVVIITEPNSHGGVMVARRAANAAARPCLLVRRLRPNGLGAVIEDAIAIARVRAVA